MYIFRSQEKTTNGLDVQSYENGNDAEDDDEPSVNSHDFKTCAENNGDGDGDSNDDD